MHTISTWWMWAGFFVFILTFLMIDMFMIGRKGSHTVSLREASFWTICWFMLAMLFNLLLWWYLREHYGDAFAKQKALEFLTGYLIEESLSVDNMFAFLMIFHFFRIPSMYQRRVLLYGVLGAIVFRLIMILLGTWIVSKFHWILYVFGVFLIFTGIKMLLFSKSEKDLANNPLLIWLQRHIRITDKLHDEHFFIKINALWYATPLFLVLVLIELSDLIFALDSIPAIFAVTNDPFIIFTSNIFAILGLRALYFLLSNMAARFYLLKYGVAFLLVFVGFKMVIEPWVKISIPIALSVVATILVTSVALSLISKRPRHE